MKNINKKRLSIALSICAVFLAAAALVFPAFAADSADVQSVTTTIQVIVYNRFPAVHLTSPLNESITTNPLIKFDVDYENVNHIDFVLSYKDAEGNPRETVIDTFAPDPTTIDPELGIYVGAGTATSREIDLRDYGDYGTYVITAKIKGVNEYDEDSVEFTYYPFNIEKTGTDPNGDPIVRVSYSPEVTNFALQVYSDPDGKRAILDDPIKYKVETTDIAGYRDFVLPFVSYGLSTDTYYVVATGVNVDAEDLGPIMRPLDYTAPAAPDVPKTGLFTGKLNIAKQDYLATSIIAFVIAIVCATAIILHKKEQQRRSSRRRR